MGYLYAQRIPVISVLQIPAVDPSVKYDAEFIGYCE